MKGKKARFQVKKWSAVCLWAWDIVVDNCAICRNHIMDHCEYRYSQVCGPQADIGIQVLNVKPTKLLLRMRSAPWPGESAM